MKIDLKEHNREEIRRVEIMISDLTDFDSLDASENDGWYKHIDQNWYYLVDGKALIGIHIIEDFFTIFDKKGVLIMNDANYKLDGNTYCITNGCAKCILKV